ncbi:YheT family hydrolase [Lacisediminimonas sp.]|uniref:YheT family hydrolase n=1 Tax=Lacisediminimonas sp. TaxID=3060582 RepID=UPI002722B7D5|nr:alpha/beta fold hydrolase [Lacisediminimonas sp.]MDO8300049.1 alpha/beta hydrolase [Lacisediminimonas sp.]
MTERYLPPRWLPGGHLQTIIPATCMRRPRVAYRRERWTAPDRDFIDVDWLDGQAGKPLVVLFHGLEGSSQSHYASALMSVLAEMGWSGAVAHFRGCSGQANLAPRFYHSGDAPEIDWLLRRFAAESRAAGHARLYAIGVSLGGNALLRWLGESQHQAEIVDAACAVSAPLDLAAGGAALSSGANLIYTRMFLQSLKPKCLHKLAQFPGLFDRDAMLGASNLYEFDNIVTAPLHGYRDTNDYWDRASARHVLHDITLPTLVLNAQNDPFLPARYLPTSAAPHVRLDYPQHGGHVGFAHGFLPGSLEWLPRRLLRFLIDAAP